MSPLSPEISTRPTPIESPPAVASQRFRPWHGLLAATWLLIVVGGVLAVAKHSVTPGRSSTLAADWPLGDKLPLDQSRPTLVMSVHAECPCSRASLAELDDIVSAHPGSLNVYVLIADAPSGESRSKASLLALAASIQGAKIISDADGSLAEKLDAETSGQTFLFDTRGHLRFSGGITASRGHVGPNEGVSAIKSLLANTTATPPSTPVYGCPMR